MPGNATIGEAAAQPQVSTDGDFSIVFVGASSASPVSTGQLTPAYSSPAAAARDLGAGDAVDCLLQALTVTQGNPAPAPASFYATPATSPGTYGTINVAGVTGTSVVANNTSVTPKGTYQPWMQVVMGGSVGTTGMTAFASLDNGRTKRLVSLGTAGEYNFPASDGWPGGGAQAGFVFGAVSSTLAALYTGLNNLRTAALAHFLITSGSPVIHAAADTADNTALTAVPAATTPATAISLYNALVARLAAHVASTTYHTTADAIATAAIVALLQVAQSTGEVEANLAALISAYNAHRVLVGGGPVHGSADSTNTSAAYSTPTAATLLAGDLFATSTLPPSWGDADLFTAGPPATGAFAAIADSGQLFGIIVITEPVQSSDFATLVTGLNYGLTFGKRWSLIVRFRDPTANETDAAYILAFQAFAAANHDNRITCLAGSLWVTDAFAGFVYARTFLAPYVARLQSLKEVSGQEGERLAQNPGWVARGPLEGASLKDAAGNTVGHDEALRVGIEAANGAPTGGGVCCYYQRNAQLAGTYVTNRVTVMYGAASEILTPMDRRVANALEQVAVGISLTAIGGADVWDPVTFALDADIRGGLGGKIAKAIRDNYANEFQNAADPNLVVVDPTVTVSGAQVSLTGALHVRFFGYTDTVALTFAATR
jgi:hypothetical protein